MRMSSSSSASAKVKKGAWTAEEDMLLRNYIQKHGEGKWNQVPLRAGLNRCRKSCRLRWLNYLRPNIKRGEFGEDEVDLMIRLHKLLGNRWSLIAGRIPGRTANDVKNYWNTHIHKKTSSGDPKKDKPETITQEKTTPSITVIKPLARTLCKIPSQFSSDHPIKTDNRTGEDSIRYGTQSRITLSDWINGCWKDLVFENEEQGTDGHVEWSSLGGLKATSGEGRNDWFDFSVDDGNLWDALNWDQPLIE